MNTLLPDVGVVALGVVVALVVQAVLLFAISRMGRRSLVAGDRWTGTYYGMSALAWLLSGGLAAYFALPFPLDASQNWYTVVSFIALVVLLVLFRNRAQKPNQQSVVMTLALAVAAWAGTALGCLIRLKTMVVS